MNHNYNIIIDDLRDIVNKSTLACFGYMAVISVVICILAITGIVPGYALISLAGFLPICILLIVLLNYYNQKIKMLSKKQQISLAAHNAKETMEQIVKNSPDTYAHDCRKKMRYLSENGVNIDEALKSLNNDIEAYNNLACEFVKECDTIEDELYSLMKTDTLNQYASRARDLKMKSKSLGITRLTDTSLFLELQACTGNLETIENNWKKLSFDLDDAYSVVDKYLQSLASNDSISIKVWGERLNEAFDALEALDTAKAKIILNELTEYNVNPNITNSLKNIITSVDEVMAE